MPGLVSNCWRSQLAGGVDLKDLIAAAAERGYDAVELRRGCLGRFELFDPPVPVATALSELPRRFPRMRFNLAMALPFLSADSLAEDKLFHSGIVAAGAVAGEAPPHLRLVDLTTTVDDLEQPGVGAVAERLVGAATRLAERGGLLSIENAAQPWPAFLTAFRTAREMLGPQADCLQLCYDPVNLLAAGEVDPSVATRNLYASELSKVHLKQRLGNTLLPRVTDGDVDWRDQFRALQQIGYCGPYLFEVDSSELLWDELTASLEYVQACGMH